MSILHLFYVITCILCVFLGICVAIHNTPETNWGRVVRNTLFAAGMLFALAVPNLVHAHIVTCTEAADILADYAQNWRDKGYSEHAVMADLDHANWRHTVNSIQINRLKYDIHGIYTDWMMSRLTPEEIRYGYLRHCPMEFVP